MANKFTHKLDSILMKLSVEELLKFNDRLVDYHDHDSYHAAQELDELTYRGSEPLSRSEWLKLIVKTVLSKEITEHDYDQVYSQT